MIKGYVEVLKNGGVGIIPTDTIYGLVGRADLPDTVTRISQLKNRSDGKGFIVLISSIADLDLFGIKLSTEVSEFLNKYWPGKVSVVMSPTLSFRLPDKKDLIEVLKQTGPLVAPSANLEGEPPAKNIDEARKYFGDKVDFYEDGGTLDSLPSTLVRIKDNKIEVLREGAVKLNK